MNMTLLYYDGWYNHFVRGAVPDDLHVDAEPQDVIAVFTPDEPLFRWPKELNLIAAIIGHPAIKLYT